MPPEAEGIKSTRDNLSGVTMAPGPPPAQSTANQTSSRAVAKRALGFFLGARDKR